MFLSISISTAQNLTMSLAPYGRPYCLIELAIIILIRKMTIRLSTFQNATAFWNVDNLNVKNNSFLQSFSFNIKALNK